MKKAEVLKLRNDNPTMTYEELSKLTGHKNGESLRCALRRIRIGRWKPAKEKEAVIKEKKLLPSERKAFEEEIKILKAERDVILELRKKFDTIKIVEEKHTEKQEATAFIVMSDWHIGEEVKKSRQTKYNEYNKDIAKTRMMRFWTNSKKLLEKESKEVIINNVVICLLGDMVSGNIHPELRETNDLELMHSILEAQRLIGSGLETFKNIPQKVHIVCKFGNHGRITEKKRNKNAAGNSTEYLMYHELAMLYPCFTWQIDEEYLSYLDIYGKVIRVHHGDEIKYNGGINGPIVPIMKAIKAWNMTEPADLDIFGHGHQTSNGTRHVANGSGIGYNEYAVTIKAEHEEPQQTFFLWDKKYGRTITAPILLT